MQASMKVTIELPIQSDAEEKMVRCRVPGSGRLRLGRFVRTGQKESGAVPFSVLSVVH